MYWLSVVLTVFVVSHSASSSITWNGTCPLIVDGTCPDSENVIFTLYTGASSAGEVLDVGSNNIAASSFNPANPTKIIIHGYTDSPAGSVSLLRSAYLARGNYNVITVDWSFLSQGPCYSFAVENLRHVGQCTAQLIQALRRISWILDVHVIGHSLGAQMANFIAQNVNPRLSRISGLDPAGPLFPLGTPLNEVLDKSDATFVDVYHTNDNMFGKMDAMGHVDFYFNGGMYQPGCYVDIVICSHTRSVRYFAESIATSKGFYGKKTTSVSLYDSRGLGSSAGNTVLAGENVDKRLTGIVSVSTASATPFALGQSATY